MGLLALLATGWQADQRAEVSLRRTAINQLTSIRAERKRQIDSEDEQSRHEMRTRRSTQSALNPSRHVIFFPSAYVRP